MDPVREEKTDADKPARAISGVAKRVASPVEKVSTIQRGCLNQQRNEAAEYGEQNGKDSVSTHETGEPWPVVPEGEIAGRNTRSHMSQAANAAASPSSADRRATDASPPEPCDSCPCDMVISVSATSSTVPMVNIFAPDMEIST